MGGQNRVYDRSEGTAGMAAFSTRLKSVMTLGPAPCLAASSSSFKPVKIEIEISVITAPDE
jgi:hypothetical protein